MYVCVCVCVRARACVCASFYGHVDRRNKLSVEIVKIELTFILFRLCVLQKTCEELPAQEEGGR